MKVRIKRQKNAESTAYWQTFDYNGGDTVSVATVLDALNYTDDLYDEDGNSAPRIRWECSCMQAVCGGCAMVINGVPALACNTFLRDLKGDELVLEPLTKFPVVADLVVDRGVIYENLQRAELYSENAKAATGCDQAHRYSVAKCLKCGLCLEVCPNYRPGEDFFGAQFANDVYFLHSRGQAEKKQLKKAYNRHFASGCSKALSCQSICPAGIETLTSILKMNRF